MKLVDIIREQFEEMPMPDFAEKRLKGATKIATDAKEKGGPAILTYHHFVVKLEHYKKAVEGNFSLEETVSLYNKYMDELHKLMQEDVPNPIDFQRIVGLLEVFGELIIKNKTTKVEEGASKSVNEVKLNDLVNTRFSIEVGSGTTTGNWSNEELIEKLKEAIKHNLFDREFYYNWTDLGKEYNSIFEKETLSPMIKNIDRTLKEFFVLKGSTLVFRLEGSNAQKWIDKWFQANKSISNELKSDYYSYRKKYAGVTLRESVNEDWSQKYKNSIDCNNPKGFSQKAHCAGKNESMNLEEKLNLFLEKNCPTDPGKWSASKAAAKSKFDVYPSAYANGWAAKNYKSKGGGWRTCNEGEENALCECWDGYKQIGGKMKNGKMVPNCVPISEEDEYPNHDNLRDADDEINYGYVEPTEYDVENEDDMKDFIVFIKEYNRELNEDGCPCVFEAEYQGRKVKLGKPMAGDVKKFKVYVKNDKGNVVKVNFGQKGVKIKKNNPDRRRSFRARHNCDTPGPRWKARYWSCRKW
jgi:hypothetical protein